MLVYLASPISGLSYGKTTEWRQTAIDFLKDFNIQGLSPMRCKEYLSQVTSIEDDYSQSPLSSQRGIYARDRFDCHRADLVLVNLLGAHTISIGTVMEIAWAAQNNTPVVLIIEKEGNIHEHSMLREACPFRVSTLQEGLDVTVAILAPTNKA